MELINSTRMSAGYTIGLERSGRELLVAVVKGTFVIPGHGEPVRLADEQLPLVTADTFVGAPGLSAPLYEIDYAPTKPRCDVLLVGSAYAPHGRPVTRVEVGMRVGQIRKTFAVVGDRRWSLGRTGLAKTLASPFTVMPISYDRAFGGTDNRHEDPASHGAFTRNPTGRGFHKHLRSEWVDGSPLPNTEELGRVVDTPNSTAYAPMSFGPIGRGWEPRFRYAGTYDDRWLEQEFPFLPPDFDDQYYQAAPSDQQIAHPSRTEEITLSNLTPDGHVSFSLPLFDAPVHFFPKSGGREDGKLTLDTVVLEPDHQRFTLTWRSSRPLRRDIFELAQVFVGRKGREWWAARNAVEFPIPLTVVAGPSDQEEDDETEDDDTEATNPIGDDDLTGGE